MSQRNIDRTNWIGVCLLVIGIIYANKHYHWHLFDLNLHLPFEIFSWPGFLIGLGLLLVVMGRGVGVALMLIGGFFLFTSEFMWAITHIHQWWPIALIVAGVLILLKSTSPRKVNN